MGHAKTKSIRVDLELYNYIEKLARQHGRKIKAEAEALLTRAIALGDVVHELVVEPLSVPTGKHKHRQG